MGRKNVADLPGHQNRGLHKMGSKTAPPIHRPGTPGEDGRLGTRIDGARRGARALRKSHDGDGWWKMPLEAAVFVGNKIKK